jgi:hypothetical protein
MKKFLILLAFLSLLIPQAVLSEGRYYAAPAAGGAIEITHVQGAHNSGAAASTTLTVSLTGVTAGDLIVIFTGWDTAGTEVNSISDGTSSFSLLNVTNTGSNRSGKIGYLLSANSGDKTYTITYSSAASNRIAFVAEFNASSGTWKFDASNQNGGTGTAATTGTIHTVGTAGVAVFGNKLFETAATASNPLINGAAPTEPAYSPVDTYHHFYYRILTATFSGGGGALTYSTSTYWVSCLATFYAASEAAPAGTEIVLQNVVDSRLDSVAGGNNNNGTHVSGYAGRDSSTRYMREIQRWDLTGIPAGSTCNSASLYLFDHEWSNRTANNATNVYEIAAGNANWVEGTGADVPQTGSSCWNYKAYDPSTPTAWAGSAGLSTAGTDYINTSLGSVTFTDGSGAGFVKIELNATALTALEAAFGSTITWVIIGDQGTAGSWTEWSSGNNTAIPTRPKLVIDYTAP